MAGVIRERYNFPISLDHHARCILNFPISDFLLFNSFFSYLSIKSLRVCFLASGVGLAGGAVIGDRVLLGGHVGVSNGIHIGNDSEIGAMSGVFRNVPANEKWMGNPAGPGIEFFRHYAWVKNQMAKEKKD